MKNPNCLSNVASSLLRTTVGFLIAAMLPFAAGAADTSVVVPGDSVYQLSANLTDQSGRTFLLSDRRGQPLLVSMFYSSCKFVCPMLVDALRATQAQLNATERDHVDVLMVTIDPAHDSVAVLARTAKQRELDPVHWTLARTDAKTVRKLAALLGVQYRALPNGDFNHTTDLILLDRQGRIAARTSELNGADPEFVKRIKLAAAP